MVTPDRWPRVAGWLASIIAQEKPAAVFIDTTSMGVGAFDRLKELGHRRVVAVNFASRPIEPVLWDEAGRQSGGAANRRSEMWLGFKRALQEGRFQITR